jgi:DNA-binding NarL/FixJ family response regulator
MNAEEALAWLGSRTWDLLILDLSMPGKSGLELLKEIKRLYPSLPVLIFSMHPELQFATRALKQGAGGYVSKDSGGEELMKAVRMVASGRKYISRELAESLASNLGKSDKMPHELLSNREYVIMRALAAGKGISEIAAELSVSPKTISTFRRRILDKMKMTTNADLTRYVIENEL